LTDRTDVQNTVIVQNAVFKTALVRERSRSAARFAGASTGVLAAVIRQPSPAQAMV
jgi:hypothetical protein